MNKIKIGSCFTGIGAWEKGFEYLGIDYIKLVPYLIKSIQELNDKIAELSNK